MRLRPLILNINDDEAGRYVMARQLKQADYEVIEAGTGEAGLKMAIERIPDLILLDVRLPDIDGFEVCRRIRASSSLAGTPVIQMSASYLDTSSRVKGLENGADAYLTEPIEGPMLLATAHSLLRMKHAEQTVRRAALQWKTTFDAIQDGVALLNTEGHLLQANEAFHKRTGEDPSSILALIEELFTPLRGSLSRQTGEQEIEGKIFSIRMDPVREGEEFAGAVCILDDVTEQKHFEQQMRHTAKLESIGVLAGGVAHDFNNLLTGILGNASLIEETLPPNAQELPLVREIVRAGESAAHLTRQLLAYSGKGHFVLQPLNLAEFVEYNRAFVERFIPARVKLTFHSQPDLPPIEADVGQMQQLVMNLIINAGESFGDTGKGSITVSTAVEDLAGVDHVVLTVADTGSGMDEATQQRIFDPFFTTKFAGRGLGLSAVHGILRGHKGTLRLQSKPGEGTTFRIYFPVANRPRPKSPAIPPKPCRQASGTILLVDDESVVRNFARAALESCGYHVLIAENGEQGVELFRLRHKEITLVVLDLTMPLMDGEEAFGHLRSIAPGVPVILSSGFSHADASERFRGKGLAGFLSKPYTGTQLAQAIEAAVNGDSSPGWS